MLRKHLICYLLVSLLLVPVLRSQERAATRPSIPGGPKQAHQTSYKNQQAQWQRFLGEKAQTELEAEMDKMINSEFGAAPQ